MLTRRSTVLPTGRLRPEPTVAVVGLGYGGPNLLRALIERTDVTVRWICDTDPSRLERFARRYPSVHVTRDLDDLLDDPDLDGVLLATPVFTHYDLACRCLDAGKHTFVEKPLAASTHDASRLIDFSEERDLVLMCGHTFLYSPPVRAVGELIRSGELGDLYFLSSSRVNLGLHQRDVSVIWDLGPHDFSIMLYWLGCMPATIRATGRDSIVRGIADVAFVTMEFDSGLIVNVELSWLAPSKLRRTVVVGSRQMVVYEDGGTEAVKIYDRGVEYKDPETFGEWHLSYRTGNILAPRLSSEEPLGMQVADFVRTIRTRELPEHALTLARDVVRLAAAAAASLENGGELIALGPEIRVPEVV
ncbi:MAG: Gfo/Idh/MocA family oxidoreductase [Solirubrobacteraceae bacterium]